MSNTIPPFEQIRGFNFTVPQVEKLMRMQDTLNTYVHPKWRDQDFNWELAILDECMEIHGHLGWKWWKGANYKQGVTAANVAQIKLELIDILHFAVSRYIQDYPVLIGRNAHDLAMRLSTTCTVPSFEFSSLICHFQADVANRKFIESILINLMQLMHVLRMSEQEVLETYTQKYVLNKFRQDHGYKDGSYVKEWNLSTGLGILPDSGCEATAVLTFEDNEVLAKEVKHIELEGQDTADEHILYSRLEALYNSRLNQ